MKIEEIVAGLKEQGLDEAAIQASLSEMLEKGEITQEDYDKALAMIAQEPVESEEQKEERIFGKL
jgi:uncharacterized protein YqgQ